MISLVPDVHGDYYRDKKKPKLDDELVCAVATVLVADWTKCIAVERFLIRAKVFAFNNVAIACAINENCFVLVCWKKPKLERSFKRNSFLQCWMTFVQTDVIPIAFSATVKAGQSWKETFKFRNWLRKFHSPLLSNIFQSCIDVEFGSRSCSREALNLISKRLKLLD